MPQDLNKGISSIQYNLLNLPSQIDILSPVAEARNTYVYAADGTKLQIVKQYNSNYNSSPIIGSAVNKSNLDVTKTTDYVGNMIFEDDELDRILVDGGYIKDGTYYFYETDHLGSNRATVSEDWDVIEHNDYYPYGMQMAHNELTNASSDNKYKYNGKELDVMHGLNLYDYSARSQDPTLGRFTSVDPLAEKYYSISPYVYCNNNPLRFIDPDGQDWFFYQAKGEKKEMWHWQKGNSAKYINTKGKEVTTKDGFDYLVTFVKTGKNSEGAATGVLKLWGNRSPKEGALVTTQAFSGGAIEDSKKTQSIPSGNYIMKLGKRDADGPQQIKADGSNPMPFDGIQKIPNDAEFEWRGHTFPMQPNVTDPYGNGRIRLNQTQSGFTPIPMSKQSAGYYLHGKQDMTHNTTHGCVCNRSEVVFNYIGNNNINTNVPFYVF